MFKQLVVLVFLLSFGIVLHAQQPGVDCAPVQGQGWTGCAPINPSQPSPQGQQPQIPQAPPQRWQDHWGAIATYEPSGVLGVATNMQSESQAKQAAMVDCQARSGGLNCKLERWYRNQCAALTVSDKGYNTTAAATADQATQEGMKICTNSGDAHCRTYYTACSLPVRIQ